MTEEQSLGKGVRGQLGFSGTHSLPYAEGVGVGSKKEQRERWKEEDFSSFLLPQPITVQQAESRQAAETQGSVPAAVQR